MDTTTSKITKAMMMKAAKANGNDDAETEERKKEVLSLHPLVHIHAAIV